MLPPMIPYNNGSPKPPSRCINVNASFGRVRTICKVSINAEASPLLCRWSHGNPVRGVADVDPAAVVAIAVGGGDVCGGGAAAAGAPAAVKSSANSENCESGCQFAMLSFQPRSLGR